MKFIKTLSLLIILFCNSVFAQVAQFPQIYFNGQGSGGLSLNIRSSASSSASVLTTLSVNSKIGAESLVTNSNDPTFMNFITVCLPSISSTNNSPNYAYMPSSSAYAQINESNNYATVNTTSTPLGVRTCANCASSYVTIGGQNAYYGKNSILALTGNTSSGWYEVYLTNNCSQTTGWVNGIYLSFPAAQNYYIVAGNICDNSGPNCQFAGNLNQAIITLGSLGNIYSSGGYYQYKVAPNWSGSITCSYPSYNTSNPTSYNYTATSHNYTSNFFLSNTSTCIPLTVSSDPSNTSVSTGSSATFTVSANGTTPITYQWQVNTGGGWSSLTNGGNTTWTTSGTTSTLSVSNTTTGMTGYTYRCVLTNSCSSNVNSNSATLTVSTGCTASAVSSHPSNTSVSIGGTATFSVSASGTTPVTYQWQVNTGGGWNNLTNGGNTSWTTSGTTSTLSISNTTIGMSGNTYRCVLSNTCSSNVNSNSATLTVTTSQNGVISGTVIAPEISDLSGMVVNNTVSATVKIFNTGSTTPLNTTTSTGGNFSFNSLALGSYDIEASISSGGVTYKTTKTNVQSGSSNVSLKLSNRVIVQIEGFNSELTNLNCFLEDLGLTVSSITSYDMTYSSNYLNTKRVMNNSYETEIEALLRLAMAERMLIQYYGQARTMSQEYVKSADEFTKAVFDLVEIVSCDPSKSGILKGLSNTMIDYMSDGVKIWMGINPNRIYFEAAIDGAADGLKAQGISLSSLYNTQRSWIHPIYLGGSLRRSYIDPTLNLPNKYVLKSQNNSFVGNIQNTIISNKDLLNTSLLKTADAQGYADGLRNNPKWVEFLFNLSPNIACVHPFVKISSIGLKGVEIGLLGYGISKSAKRTLQLVNEVDPTANNSYYKTGGIELNVFNESLHSSRSINAANAVVNFENEYFSTISELSAGNYTNVKNHVATLVTLNKVLDEVVKEETQAIKSTLYSLSVEDSMVFNSLKNTLICSPLQRAGQMFALYYFSENQNELLLKDSILAYSNLVYTFNANMLNELNTLASSLTGIKSYPYISIKQSTIPLVTPPNTILPVTLTIKNYGSTNATNVFVKMEIAPFATFSTDSFYIGSLLANEEKVVSFSVNSSILEDSLSFYIISIHGDSILSDGKGGAILSKKDVISGIKAIGQFSEMVSVYPNPNKGSFRVTTGITPYKPSQIKLYSSMGQLVYTKEAIPTENKFDEVVSTSNLPKGIYTLLLLIDGKQHTKKVIVE